MKRLRQTEYPVVALTHPGMKGKNNEDCFGVAAFSQGWLGARPILLAVLSDGIGGHKAGEVASELAVNLISAAVEKREGGAPLAVFENSFYRASEAIHEHAEQDSSRTGMGATAACAWVIGQQLYIAYAGDSRIYLIRKERIRQLSHDHTWVQEALDKGILDATGGIKNHPNMHVIRRYLGSEEPSEPDLRLFMEPGETSKQARNNQGLSLLAGDVVMLCTDGLTDLVNENEIIDSLAGHSLQQAAQALINLACERGGHDNITVIMLGMPWDPAKLNPGWRAG